MSQFSMATDGTVLLWGVDGVPVLYPFDEHTYALSARESRRGGAPVCAPMFSVLPESLRRIGLDMPIHGLVMGSEGALSQSATEAVVKCTLGGDQSFAWKHQVLVAVSVSGRELHHTLTLSRSTDCNELLPMPYSLGFHPYFSTFGEPITIELNGDMYTVDDFMSDESYIFPGGPEHPVVLTTSQGQLTVTPKSGYDEWCIWSDDYSKYVCIEPILGYQKFGTGAYELQRGQTVTTAVTLTF